MKKDNDFNFSVNTVVGVNRMLAIDEKCNLCGKCVELCPFGALKLSKDGDIMFKFRSCVEKCEVCRLICTEGANSLSFISSGCSGNCSSCASNCKNSNKN